MSFAFRFPRRVTAALAVVAVATLSAATAVQAADANVPSPEFNLEPELAAKLFKERARQKTTDGATAEDYGATSGNDPCGNVVINSNNQAKSNSGIGGMFGKESVTIITGPVINAANCK
ncbi:MAG: hypothetical protein LBB76_13070 [Azoarcus sp.]|jgi:hypothetical protein|nr:hypothetical protein [Azoarcus sp.]